MSIFWENPVLVKEVRSRLRARRQGRGGKIGVIATVAIVIVLLYFFGVRGILGGNTRGAADTYMLLTVGFQLTLTLFLIPSLAATAITQEREQQTWNALLLSRLTHGQIVVGKYLSCLLPVSLILAMFVPLNLLAAFVGSLPGALVALSGLLIVATALFMTALALFFSWAFRRSYVATAATFASIAFLVVGTYILEFLWSVASPYGRTNDDNFFLVWLNPYRALLYVLNEPPGRNYGIAVVYIVFCLAMTVLLLAIMTRRLSRGPKEMEQ